MIGHSVTLFRIFGFRVRANFGWVLLALLITWTLAAGYFPLQHPELADSTYWLMGLLAMLGLFFSLLFHELSHSLVARARGMPMGGITLFLFGGVAEMHDEPPNPKIEVEVAGIGPLSSFFLAGIFYLLSGLLAAIGLPEHWTAVAGYLALINVVLAVFNLFPGYPLDGGRLLRALLWHLRGDIVSATRTASRVGIGFGTALIILGFLSLLAGALVGGVWWILIGMFITVAARTSYDQLLARMAFQGTPVSKLMVADPVSVSADTSLKDFVEDYAYRYHYSLFPVTRDNHLVGCVRTRDVTAIPRKNWPHTRVDEIMKRCDSSTTIDSNTDTTQALQMLQKSNTGQLIVTEKNELAGLVTLRDLLDYLSIRQQLDG
jgi:Zn-dependent protease/CBS domain-containing protein